MRVPHLNTDHQRLLAAFLGLSMFSLFLTGVMDRSILGIGKFLAGLMVGVPVGAVLMVVLFGKLFEWGEKQGQVLTGLVALTGLFSVIGLFLVSTLLMVFGGVIVWLPTSELVSYQPYGLFALGAGLGLAIYPGSMLETALPTMHGLMATFSPRMTWLLYRFEAPTLLDSEVQKRFSAWAESGRACEFGPMAARMLEEGDTRLLTKIARNGNGRWREQALRRLLDISPHKLKQALFSEEGGVNPDNLSKDMLARLLNADIPGLREQLFRALGDRKQKKTAS